MESVIFCNVVAEGNRISFLHRWQLANSVICNKQVLIFYSILPCNFIGNSQESVGILFKVKLFYCITTSFAV